MTTPSQNLKNLGITIREVAVPVANYVGYTKSGKTIFVSGQLPLQDGSLHHIGIVGKDITVSQAKEAAKMCAINLIAQVSHAVNGDLEKIKCLKLGVFVNAIPGFADHPEVANGASDLMVAVFGEKGKHSRAAVGSGSLPRNVSVEVDAIFEIE